MAAEKHQIQRKTDTDSDVTFAREVAQPSNSDSATLGTANPQQLSEALSNSGSGASLDSGAREFLEPKFGHSFENVKIHADGRADELSKSVGARAFTTGQDVYFREGEYKPGSPEGRHLLAHELTHTIQQSRGSVSGTNIGGGVSISEPGDSFEQEASSAADTVTRGGQVAVGGTAGNSIQRSTASGDLTLQRDTPTPAPAPAVTPTTMPAPAAGGTFEQNLADADILFRHGLFGPTEVQPNGGAFSASYDPAAGVMNVVIRAAINFQDAISSSGGSITPANAHLQSLANTATGLSPAQRAAFMAQYQWNAAEKAGWMTNMESTVEAAWGGKHQFHINKPQFEWIGARIAVDVQTHEGARAGNDHLSVDAIKMPPGENLANHNDAAVHNVTNPDGTVTDTGPETGSAFVNNQDSTNSFDGQMVVSSNDFAPRHDNLLRNSVNFDHNSADVDAAARGRLTQWVATFQGAPGTAGSRSIALKLEAHTSASGTANYNRDLAQRRANSVQAELTTLGFTNVTGAVVTDPQGEVAGSSTTDDNAAQRRQRRVDLIVDSGAAQVIGAHEMGHAFGLGDEYATGSGSMIQGTGAAAGTAASHDGLTKGMTDASGNSLPGAVNENNDNIMSLGNTVQPQHYSTFHAALQQITSINEWALGAATARPSAPSSGTPAPTPATPAPTATPAPATTP